MRKVTVEKTCGQEKDAISLICQFCIFAVDSLAVPDMEYGVILTGDKEKHGIKTTAYYDPRDNTIKIYAKGRMLMDSLRSLAHEMTHMMQNEMGLITGPVKDEGGFHEDQANAKAGLIVKRFIKRSGIKF